MVARSIRTALLLVAAWALLFAPGAAGAGSGGEDWLLDSEHIAAAVIAPTFGPDALIIGRDCWSDADEIGGACRGETGPLPVAAVVVSVGFAVGISLVRSGIPTFSAVSSLTARAPPVG